MSSVIDLKLDGDGAWPDLKVKQDSGKLSWQGNGSVIRICCLSRGTESGRPTAAIRIDMRDGTARGCRGNGSQSDYRIACNRGSLRRRS